MTRTFRFDPDAAAVAGLAALAVLQFLPAWAQGLAPFWGDLTYLHYPWRTLGAQVLIAGRAPLWDPYLYFGMPMAARMQDALFYPGSLPFFLFGFATGTALFHAFHYGLAGVMAYLWLRSLRLPRAASWGGALLYGFGGVMMSRMPFLNHLAALSLAPCLLLFFSRPALLAPALALAFLAGYPPFLIGSALGAWGLGLILCARPRGGWAVSAAGRWAAAGIFAMLLSACLLLPAEELFRHSRRASGISLEEALGFGFGPRDLLQWVSPLLVGRAFDPAAAWWKCSYLGFSGCLAALWGISRLAFPRALGILAFLAGILLLLLGGSNPLSLAFWTHVPGIQFIRYPGNLAYLALPAISLLAAAGLRGLRARLWLAAAIALELSAYGWGAYPTARRDIFPSAGPIVRFLQARLGGDRYLLSPRALHAHAGSGLQDWKFRLYGLTNAPFRLRAAGNFGEPLVPRPSYDFMDALFRAESAEVAAALFSWADIRFLLTPDRIPPSPLLRYEGRSLWEIYRFTGPLAPAYAFGASGENIPAEIPEEVSRLAPGRPLAWRRDREDRFEVPGEGQGWVYVAEPRYPGWKVRVETPLGGSEVRSLPALTAFQKVPVPPGRWTLHFRYLPANWRLGRLLTVLSLMALALHWYNALLRIDGR